MYNKKGSTHFIWLFSDINKNHNNNNNNNLYAGEIFIDFNNIKYYFPSLYVDSKKTFHNKIMFHNNLNSS